MLHDQCILAPLAVIWTEIHVMSTNEFLEIIQYMFAGILYSFVLIVFVIKKEAIFSNYKIIKTDFVKFSKENGRNPNDACEKLIHLVKHITMPSTFVIIGLTFGPLLSTLFDLGELPLDHRSHFVFFWPKVSPTRKILLSILIFFFFYYFYHLAF